MKAFVRYLISPIALLMAIAISNGQALSPEGRFFYIGIEKSPLNAIAIIADEKGYLPEDIKTKYFLSGKIAMKAMFEGDVDMSIPSGAPIAINSHIRRDFKIVANIGYTYNEPRLVARKDKSIFKPSDLIGKRIATQEGSAVHFFLYVFLSKYRINTKELQRVFIHPDEMLPALIRGEIDGFTMSEPYIKQAKDALGDRVVIFSANGLHRKTYSMRAMDDFIKNHPKLLVDLLNGLLKAELFIKDNPEHAIEILSSNIGIKVEDIKSIWQELNLEVSLDQSFIRGLENQSLWACKNKLIDDKSPLNYLDFIYFDAMDSLYRKRISIIR